MNVNFMAVELLHQMDAMDAFLSIMTGALG